MKNIILILAIALLASCKEEKKGTAGSPDFCASIHIDKGAGLGAKLDSLSGLMSKTGVYVLEDGDGSMIARAWLCENAEKSIDVQYFIFSTDNVGLIAADYLVRAADRGVKVRILVDDVMVEADEEKLLTLDSHENISIKIYNPTTNVGKNVIEKVVSMKENFIASNQRMHNKSFTVDGKVVITGGRNIADEYFDYDHEYNFRDRDVLLIGGVVKDIQGSFNDYWNNALCRDVAELVDSGKYELNDPARFDALHRYACDSSNFWPQVRKRITNVPNAFDEIQKTGMLQWVDKVQFVSDRPGKNDGSEGLSGGGITTDTLMALITRARKSILIQSPYLVTTDLGKQMMREVVKKGVSVKILTNSLASTDNLESFSGYQRDRKELLATGVRIFEFRPDAAVRKKLMTGALQKELDHMPVFGLHAKTMVIDDEITVIGTFNMDPRSANLNTECITIIYSTKIAAEVRKVMEEELRPENAWEATSEFNPDKEASLIKRVKVAPMKVIPKDIL
ncbi:MAG TPA: phospholipase D family protein [Bacteroidia bacterium]|jgi:phosphatidylserine/phosphatidylglycerophosphate/cardiolipin synthase-like enzyme